MGTVRLRVRQSMPADSLVLPSSASWNAFEVFIVIVRDASRVVLMAIVALVTIREEWLPLRCAKERLETQMGDSNYSSVEKMD